jgi:hypothetical protein
VIDDIERLDAALERRPAPGMLSERLVDLVDVAGEVARVLATPLLSAGERERLYRRAVNREGWGDRLRHRLPRLARRPTVVGGAAAVTLAVVGIALLRGRSHPALGGAAA